MEIELTPEKIMEMGRFWDETYLSQFNVKEILSVVNHQKILADLPIEEIEDFLRKVKETR